jgi:hypothetical protein
VADLLPRHFDVDLMLIDSDEQDRHVTSWIAGWQNGRDPGIVRGQAETGTNDSSRFRSRVACQEVGVAVPWPTWKTETMPSIA